jgi:hypothetical protein
MQIAQGPHKHWRVCTADLALKQLETGRKVGGRSPGSGRVEAEIVVFRDENSGWELVRALASIKQRRRRDESDDDSVLGRMGPSNLNL